MAFSSRRVAATWLSSVVREARKVEAKAFDLFDNFPDEDDEPEPAAKAPEKPQEPEKAKRKPKAPAKPKAPKKEPEKAPEKPARKHDLFDNFPHEVEDEPANAKPQDLPEGLQLYKKFLGERYEDGKAQVANPVRENRDRYPDVSFETAMKDQSFRQRVQKEFEEWKGKLEDAKDKKDAPAKEEDAKKKAPEEDKGPRVGMGAIIKDVKGLRVGDFLHQKNSPVGKILEMSPRRVLVQWVSRNGTPLGKAVPYHHDEFDGGSYKRVHDPSSPEGKKQREEESAEREKAEKEKAEKEKAEKEKAEKPRFEIGHVINDLKGLRPGDVIQSDRPNAPMRRVVEVGDGEVLLQPINDDGDPSGHVDWFPARGVAGGRHKRIADPTSPEKQKEREEKRKREEAEAEAAKKRDEARKERSKEKTKSMPAWRRKMQEKLDIALEGKVAKDKPLGGGVNTSIKRTMKLGNKTADFVWKPAEGESDDDYGNPYRRGIKAGEFHRREASSYSIDALFGEGTVVPPTSTNGKGSYQLFQPGSKTLYDSMYEFSMYNEHLKENPDFQRMLFLDQVLGHEDRHVANIMVKKEKDGKIRFIAIDNGLALADPDGKDEPSNYCMREPWSNILGESGRARQEMMREVMSDMPEELHKKYKAVKLNDFIDSLVDNGITNERVIRAAAVRLVALQRNPKVLGQYLEEGESPMTGSRDFQYASGKNPAKVLEDAGGEGHSLEDINEAIKRALR